MELQEVRGGVAGHRLDVVVAHREAPRSPEVVRAPPRGGVAEVGGVEEVARVERAGGGPADEPVVRVGLQAAAGALDVDVGGREHLAHLDAPGGDERLGEVDPVHHLAGGHRARRRGAERLLHLAHPLHHLGELSREQADLVVVALEVAVDGEVLLDDPRAERDGGEHDVEAALVAGVADRGLGQLGQPGEVGQVDVLERSRVGRLAVQERVRDAGLADDVDGLADLALGRHPGRDDHRGAAGRHVPQQRVVGHVGGGDLERADAVVDEAVDADRVPGGAHHLDADVAAVVEDLEELVGPEVVLREQVEGVLRAEVLPARPAGALAVEGVHVAQLELHHVGPGLDRQVDQPLGQRHVALVVDADL